MPVRELAGQRARVGVELLEGDEADVGVVERREEQPTRVDRKPNALGPIKNLFWKFKKRPVQTCQFSTVSIL